MGANHDLTINAGYLKIMIKWYYYVHFLVRRLSVAFF